MAKGSGTTRSSGPGSPRGLGASLSEVSSRATTRAFSAPVLAEMPKVGTFTSKLGTVADLDSIARDGYQEDTWTRKSLVPTVDAGKVPEREVDLYGEGAYEFENGKKPSGVGGWMFRIGSKREGTVVSFPTMSYADAKKAARKIAAAYGYRNMTVMP